MSCKLISKIILHYFNKGVLTQYYISANYSIKINNFSKTCMALFAVNRFSDKKLAFSLPIFCMIVTDIFLGFHSITPFVYMSIIGISCSGHFSKKINNVAILKSSILFFFISNFTCFTTTRYS